MLRSKRFITKFVITLLLFIISMFSLYRGVIYALDYNKSKNDLDEVISTINKPLNNKKAVVDPISVSSLLSSMQGVESIDLITKIDCTSLDYIANKSLELKDISSLKGINLIELNITVNDIALALKSLENTYLVYDFIDISGNSLTLRIYVKGD